MLWPPKFSTFFLNIKMQESFVYWQDPQITFSWTESHLSLGPYDHSIVHKKLSPGLIPFISSIKKRKKGQKEKKKSNSTQIQMILLFHFYNKNSVINLTVLTQQPWVLGAKRTTNPSWAPNCCEKWCFRFIFHFRGLTSF